MAHQRNSKPHLLCRLFGHIRRPGWWGDSLYGQVIPGPVDNLNTFHFEVVADCDRCGCEYTLARFHGNIPLKYMYKYRAMLRPEARQLFKD